MRWVEGMSEKGVMLLEASNAPSTQKFLQRGAGPGTQGGGPATAAGTSCSWLSAPAVHSHHLGPFKKHPCPGPLFLVLPDKVQEPSYI